MVHNGYMDKSTKSQLSIRLDESMRQALHAEARANGRSLNAEITYRLLFTMNHPDVLNEYEKVHTVSFVPVKPHKTTDSSREDSSVTLDQLSSKIDRLQNYIDSEKFSARLFKQAFSYFSKK